MLNITKNTVVTLDFQLKNDQGELIDSSAQTGPMVYIQGTEDVLQGIEDAVEGLTVLDKVDVTINPEDAYGQYESESLSTVPKSAFDGIEIEVGMQLQEETSDGPILVTIKEINEDQVMVDTNHPLAGQKLMFSLQVTSLRDATADELAHGHVHGPHGHEH